MKLTLVSVNVAQPKVLATVDEQTVMSAIGKEPVTTREIRVLKETLEGDRVADRSRASQVRLAKTLRFPGRMKPRCGSATGSAGATPFSK